VEASQLLAVRISNFGGLVGNLAPGASISNGKLRVIAFKTFSRMRYLRFLIAVLCGRHSYSRTIELVKCVSVECRNLEGSAEQLFVEADGELLGTLPVRIEVEPQALNLLIPAKALGRITDL
jgi:diacylglycerol kinase family enzyme